VAAPKKTIAVPKTLKSEVREKVPKRVATITITAAIIKCFKGFLCYVFTNNKY
jgi:hypothetical protein